MLAALEDAAALRREVISNCPDCRSADARICTDHEGSWETADEYDSLRWHLDSSRRDRQADLVAGAAPVRAPSEHLQPKEPGVRGDHSGRKTQATAAPDPGQLGQGGEPEPEEAVPIAVPGTSHGVPPEVYNAIADYAGEVSRPKYCPDGQLYMSAEEEASLDERFGEGQADPGPTEDQIIGWNEANVYRNKANDYEADREAGVT